MRISTVIFAFCFWSPSVLAIGQPSYVTGVRVNGSFPIADERGVARIYVDPRDWPGVVRAAVDLQEDIARVTGHRPELRRNTEELKANTILVGTIGRSPAIDGLIKAGKIDVRRIRGKWESFFLETVADPLPNVSSALVIAGSDKRGTIYGIYDLSEQIGVSPWYWWADVRARHQDTLYVRPGKYMQGEPSVKYRGIFLNDEAPDLTNWVAEKYGTIPTSADPPIPSNVANYNHEFYARIFEVILRLKGNYLWPAMWNNAFNEDDPDNARLSDEFGIVMGTSHQEPMLRAQKEWDRRYQKTLGSWNYYKYPDVLQNFWREGIRRNKNYESIITLGLRGADDTPMIPGGTVAECVSLLEGIVDVQRRMISEEISPDVTHVPQLWCLYKEVLEYYRTGLRVPEDVTLLWSDDNWGNIRRLPTEDERKRPGGAGIYYHFDYVGGPRNYKWINTNPTPKIWEQLTLAKKYGADRIWIVNVGHFKGLELPMEFFMHLAWDAERWTNQNLDEYTRLWAAREFGLTYAADIAAVISSYTRYNGRRKPELLDPDTYSATNYQEAERVAAEFKEITAKAEQISAKLPAEQRDAFYQLVLFPTKACAQVNELYAVAGRNALYARQGRAATNDLAARAEALFKADADLMNDYNHNLAGGKWNHFMDQVHIGYTIWQDPPQNVMPRVVRIQLPEAADMGVAVEDSTAFSPATTEPLSLPVFDRFNQQRHFIDVFNRGQGSFAFTAAADARWIVLSATKGTVAKEERIWATVDWRRAPEGSASGTIRIRWDRGRSVDVKVSLTNPARMTLDQEVTFVEGEGVVSIEAEHYTRNIPSGGARWERIEGYGRTLSAMSILPVTAQSVIPPENSPRLEYDMALFHSGDVVVHTIVAPTLNFVPGRGLRYAVSFDDLPAQIIEIVAESFDARNGNREWEESVKDAARDMRSTHRLARAGRHTLKIWMVDPAVVVQKIVVDVGGLKPSYLGPPESFRNPGIGSGGSREPAGGRGQAPGDTRGAAGTGRYRNLFAEAGHSQNEVTAKIESAFQQLFHGDPDTQTLYYPAGNNANGPLAYLTDINNNDVRTEGMSYGMMIAVQLNRKAEFDALWNWARTYMFRDEPGHPGRGFFSWSLKTDGTRNSDMPAPDGEEYLATALYFASGRWGNGTGIYNYRAAADRLLTDMRHRELVMGSTSQGMRTAGNMFHPDYAMVRFTPDTDFTDPSYHLPAFYELWAQWGPVVDRPFWAQAAAASRDFFQKATHPRTGLAPDYADYDGTPRGGDQANFQYDAWRTAMNWAVDWSWWAKDEREQALSDRLQAFSQSKGLATYGNRYDPGGTQLDDSHSTGLVAMNAVTSLAATQPRARLFVDALWNAAVPTGRYRYYDGMLYFLALLHCSGSFRIWTPH